MLNLFFHFFTRSQNMKGGGQDLNLNEDLKWPNILYFSYQSNNFG